MAATAEKTGKILDITILYNHCYEGQAQKSKKQIGDSWTGLSRISTLSKKCPYLELFWSGFSRIRTESGEIRSISPQSIRMRENADQNNSKCGHFSRRVVFNLIVKSKSSKYNHAIRFQSIIPSFIPKGKSSSKSSDKNYLSS